MKFTEEQFNKLVGLQEKEYPDNVYSSSKSDYNNIDEALKKYDLELYRFIEDLDLENQAVALMNIVTRELVHDRFVEKEKQYVWNSKKTLAYKDFDYHKRLFRSQSGDVAGVLKAKSERALEVEKLTETEIREWGYDPERFDKEEVK
ncbi:hypothetical protein PH197_07465 [Leuconostoc lactis]|uniref:hypothetical protein n=1 Tax=Leuconostoc lactis TaxID=1246 RepID=UPI002729FDA5|nr:hypothetical protein [Leuconostoc lactis]WKY79083.1 hypothetical protein PH197_07465 [Leuconostoc lactis]